MGDVNINLRATDNTGSVIAGATSHLRALQSEAERGPGIFGRLTSGLGGLTSGLGGVLQVASGVLGAGIFTGLASQAHDFFAGAIQESRDAAHGMAQTEAVIKSTGGSAGVTAGQIADLAGSLSHTTLFSDDAVQAQQNLLLTFTQVQNKAGEGNDIFTQASKIGLDMAQALGTDAAGGAVALGKALNDPEKGITALTRVGVTFSAEQQAQIKNFQAHNNVIGAQKIILAELNKEFGGSAAAALAADGGYHQFQQTLADTKQVIGDALQPALAQLMSFLSGPVLGAVSQLAVAFAGALPAAIGWLTGTALPALSAGWQTLVATTAPVVSLFTAIGSAIGAAASESSGIIDFISNLYDELGQGQGDFNVFLALFQDLVGFAYDATAALQGFSEMLGGDFAGGWQIVSEAAQGFLSDLQFLASDLTTLLLPIGETIVAQLGQWGQAFLDWIGPQIPGILAALSGLAMSIGSWIVEQGGALGSLLLSWGQGFVDWIAPYVGPALEALAAFGLSIGTWILEQGTAWGAQLLQWGQQFLTWIAPLIPPLLAQLGAIALAIGSWILEQGAVLGTQLLAWGQGFVAWIGPMIPPALAALGGLITSIGGWVVAQVPVIAAQLAAWGQSFITWIQPMIPPALAALGALATSLLGWVSQQAAPILASLGAWATSFVAWIGPATVKFLGEWPGMLNQFLDWIGSAAGPLLLKLGEWALQFVAWIAPMIPGFVVGLGAVAVALIAFVGETVVTLAGKLLEWAGAFIDWIGTNVVPKLPGALAAITGAIGSWIAGTALPWLRGEASSLGTAIIDGIKAGIAAGASIITGALTSLAHGALAAAKAALGIHSPSTVFADEVGVPIVQGMRLGILNTMPGLLAAMRGSTNDLIQEIAGFIDSGDATSTLNAAGAQAINALIAGLNSRTDLAPSLPALAASFTHVADAAKAAAAATTRATDDILSHANFKGSDGADPFSFLKPAGGLDAGADYARQAGSSAGMTFGTGWQQGIEQIRPQIQDTTRLTFQQLQDVVLLPWQTATNNFFSGAGFGFIGQASIGINSAGNGLAQSAGNVGGAAGASLVASMRGNLPGVAGFVTSVNADLAKIERDITIHVHTSYDGGSAPQPPHRASGGPVTAGMPYIVGEHRPELFVPSQSGYILPSVTSAPSAGSSTGPTHVSITFGDIYQQPGEDAEALANRLYDTIRDRMRRDDLLAGLR